MMTLDQIEVCSFTMPIRARSKQRPRSAKGGHFYTPIETREYEKEVREYAEAYYFDSPVDYTIKLEIHIEEVIPKSWSAWKKQAAEHGFISPNKGDLDNRVKAISDALNGVVYVDDVQINNLVSSMRYSTRNRVSVAVHKTGLSIAELKEWQREFNNRGSARMGG